jgi:hypothetical protein
VGAAFTIVVLSAVAVVALPLFGSEVLVSWKLPERAEQALSTSSALAGLVDFGAPVALGARFKAQTEEAKASIQRADNASSLVRNWKYTQSPTTDALALSLNLYFQALQAEIFLSAFNNSIQQLLSSLSTSSSPFAPFLSTALMTFQNQVNGFLTSYVNTLSSVQSLINPLIPASFRPPPIPPASP